jgi:hypothetical protein
MLGRILLAFTGTGAVCLGIAWMRGGFDLSDRGGDSSNSAGTRQITLAISGMH